MFTNIGGKIKFLAKVICWTGVVLSVLFFIYRIADAIEYQSDKIAIIGFIVFICGPILSWVGSFVLYGFGQLIENTDKLVNAQYTKQENEYDNYTNKTEQTNSWQDNTSSVTYYHSSNGSTPNRTTHDDTAYEEAIRFINWRYSIQIELDDNLSAIKEKVSKIVPLDKSEQIFVNRTMNARSLDEASAVMKMHFTGPEK